VNRDRLYKASGAVYIGIYILAMVFPRKVPKDQLVTDNFLKKLFQELLYLSGNLECIGNIFLLIPIFVILVKLFARFHAVFALTICILISASAEFAQSFIPGRVSSLRDFLLNCTGSLIVFLLSEAYSNRKRLIKLH
jgi:glycopeptide antibiotics resistance protein